MWRRTGWVENENVPLCDKMKCAILLCLFFSVTVYGSPSEYLLTYGVIYFQIFLFWEMVGTIPIGTYYPILNGSMGIQINCSIQLWNRYLLLNKAFKLSKLGLFLIISIRRPKTSSHPISYTMTQLISHVHFTGMGGISTYYPTMVQVWEVVDPTIQSYNCDHHTCYKYPCEFRYLLT